MSAKSIPFCGRGQPWTVHPSQCPLSWYEPSSFFFRFFSNLLTGCFVLPWDHPVPMCAYTLDFKDHSESWRQYILSASLKVLRVPTHWPNFLSGFWGSFPQPCLPLLLQGLFSSVDAKSVHLLCIVFFVKRSTYLGFSALVPLPW